jgi:hypothetical protein
LKGKGIIFLGESFVLGLIGKPDLFDISLIEEACKSMSKKEIKVNKIN